LSISWENAGLRVQTEISKKSSICFFISKKLRTYTEEGRRSTELHREKKIPADHAD
jgi:hypothetical protein